MSVSLLTDDQLDARLGKALGPLYDEVRYLRAEVCHLTRQRGKGKNTEEVAQYLGVSVATVKRWADPDIGRKRDGKKFVLKSSKLEGGQYRFNQSDVEEFEKKFLL